MQNPFGFSGKRILVTGASSGIGRSCAQALSSLGARVAAAGRDEARLKACLGSLQGAGHSMHPFDLGDLEGIDEWMDGVARDGKLDGLVHCAGAQLLSPIKATEASDFRDQMAINVDAAFALSRSFRRKAVRAPKASIALISSVAGIRGQSGLAAYSASKAALLGLCRSMAVELAAEGVRVNCVLPGYVRSEMYDEAMRKLTPDQAEDVARGYPLGLGSAEDVAYAVAYLLSDAARWVTGSGIVVDGGYSA